GATDGWRCQPSHGRKSRCKTQTRSFMWFVFSAAFFVHEARVAGRSRARVGLPPLLRSSVLNPFLRTLRSTYCDRFSVRASAFSAVHCASNLLSAARR